MPTKPATFGVSYVTALSNRVTLPTAKLVARETVPAANGSAVDQPWYSGVYSRPKRNSPADVLPMPTMARRPNRRLPVEFVGDVGVTPATFPCGALLSLRSKSCSKLKTARKPLPRSSVPRKPQRDDASPPLPIDFNVPTLVWSTRKSPSAMPYSVTVVWAWAAPASTRPAARGRYLAFIGLPVFLWADLERVVR